MESLDGMKSTGRTVEGPDADLIEFMAENGLKHTAIVFHEEYADSPEIWESLKDGGDFLLKPEVPGVMPVTAVKEAEGAVVYPTGTSISVAELITACAELGEPAGVRAGLELCYRAATALTDAVEKGHTHDFYNHGSLSPWRVLVRMNGAVQIIGYGLPAVDIIAFLEDETFLPREDGFRYCPPERLEDQEEDISSDLLALALMSCELIMGEPVYQGLLNDIRQQAARAEGSYRLYKWRERIPDAARDELSRAVKYDLDARHADPMEFVYAIFDVLQSPDARGPTLAEVAQRCRHHLRPAEAIMGGKTSMMTPQQIAALAADLDEEVEEAPLEAPSRPRPTHEEAEDPENQERWGRVRKGGRRTGIEAKRSAVSTAEQERQAEIEARRERLKSRMSSSGGAEARSARTSSDDRRAALRQRLKRSGSSDSDDPRSRLKSRLQRSSEDDPRSRLKSRLSRSSVDDDAQDPRARLKSRLRRSDEAEEDPRARLKSRLSRSRDDDSDDPRARLKSRLRSSAGSEEEQDPRERLRSRLRRSRDTDTAQPPSRLRASDDDSASDSTSDVADDVSEEVDAAAALLARLRSSVSSAEKAATPPPPSAKQAAEPAEEEDDEVTLPEFTGAVLDTDKDDGHDDGEDVDDAPTSDGEQPVVAASLQITVAGRSVRVPVALASSAGAVAQVASAALALEQHDLMGARHCAWQLAGSDGPVSSATPSTALDPRQSWTLHRVDNRTVMLSIEVLAGDRPIRFQAPVGLAQPTGAVVAHLKSWLDLDERSWYLSVNGKPVSAHVLLAELNLEDGDKMVVMS